MRKRISEQNIFPNFNLFDEYKKIEHHISGVKIVGVKNISSIGKAYYTYDGTIEDLAEVDFLGWGLRGTFLSIAEMRKSLGVDKAVLNSDDITKDQALDFLQYAINCIFRALGISDASQGKFIFGDENYVSALNDNIRELLSMLGAQCKFIKTSGCSEAVVIYNNSLGDALAEKEPDIASSIYEYRHIDNRGDIQKKCEILCTLAKDLEPHEKTLKGTIYQPLVSDATFLLNKARHNVALNKGNEATFGAMTDSELEIWYDRAFELYLLSKYAIPSLDIMREVKQIKQSSDKGD